MGEFNAVEFNEKCKKTFTELIIKWWDDWEEKSNYFGE